MRASGDHLQIIGAQVPAHLRTVRTLFREYQADIAADLCFQSFTSELAGLPGPYAPPDGRLLLARRGRHWAGCGALRPLAALDRPAGICCEMKRLYVRPAHRQRGIGRRLAAELIAAARAIGYGWMRLDTLVRLASALLLYRELGFREIAPYYANPLSGTVYLELDLHAALTPAGDGR